MVLKPKEGEKAKRTGIEVTSLLNAGIRPGRRIQVLSKYLDAVYKVEKVTHAGDTHGGEWYSQVEAV